MPLATTISSIRQRVPRGERRAQLERLRVAVPRRQRDRLAHRRDRARRRPEGALVRAQPHQRRAADAARQLLGRHERRRRPGRRATCGAGCGTGCTLTVTCDPDAVDDVANARRAARGRTAVAFVARRRRVPSSVTVPPATCTRTPSARPARASAAVIAGRQGEVGQPARAGAGRAGRLRSSATTRLTPADLRARRRRCASARAGRGRVPRKVARRRRGRATPSAGGRVGVDRR